MSDGGPAAWEHLLPVRLQNAAYRTRNEFAWPRDEALEVVSFLEQHNYDILGVEPWIPTVPGPTPTLYNWNVDTYYKIPGFPRTPSDFVKFFSWDKVDIEEPVLKPHFCFTVD